MKRQLVIITTCIALGPTSVSAENTHYLEAVNQLIGAVTPQVIVLATERPALIIQKRVAKRLFSCALLYGMERKGRQEKEPKDTETIELLTQAQNSYQAVSSILVPDLKEYKAVTLEALKLTQQIMSENKKGQENKKLSNTLRNCKDLSDEKRSAAAVTELAID